MPIYTVLAYPISRHYQEPHTNRNEFITSLAETIVILMHTNVCPSQFHFVLFICFNTTGSREHQENHRYGRLSLSHSNRLKHSFLAAPPGRRWTSSRCSFRPHNSRLRMGCPVSPSILHLIGALGVLTLKAAAIFNLWQRHCAWV